MPGLEAAELRTRRTSASELPVLMWVLLPLLHQGLPCETRAGASSLAWELSVPRRSGAPSSTTPSGQEVLMFGFSLQPCAHPPGSSL